MMTPEEKKEAAAERRRKSKRQKHLMEVTRTVCAVIALCLNIAVLTHVVGLW